jgi:hypothetical protein
VFADADDEIAPSSVTRILALLQGHHDAPGELGRTIVDEHGHDRRGRNPSTAFHSPLATHRRPHRLFWLTAFQGFIASTALRTNTVRDAGGSPTTTPQKTGNSPSDARRRPFICIDEAVRIYHRHRHATRIAHHQPPTTTLGHTICSDCITDPRVTPTHRLIASALRRGTQLTRLASVDYLYRKRARASPLRPATISLGPPGYLPIDWRTPG